MWIFFRNDYEMIPFFSDFSKDNKTCLFIPALANYKAIDFYVFLPSQRKTFHPPLIGITKLNDLMLCFQVKKDFDVSCRNCKEIQEKWKEKKK